MDKVNLNEVIQAAKQQEGQEERLKELKEVLSTEQHQILLNYLLYIYIIDMQSSDDVDFHFGKTHQQTDNNQQKLRNEQEQIQAILRLDKKAVASLFYQAETYTNGDQTVRRIIHIRRQTGSNPIHPDLRKFSQRSQNPIESFIYSLPEYLTELEYLAIMAVLIANHEQDLLDIVKEKWTEYFRNTESESEPEPIAT